MFILEFHVRIGQKKGRAYDEAKSGGEYKSGAGAKDEPPKPPPVLNVHIVLGGQVRRDSKADGDVLRNVPHAGPREGGDGKLGWPSSCTIGTLSGRATPAAYMGSC